MIRVGLEFDSHERMIRDSPNDKQTGKDLRLKRVPQPQTEGGKSRLGIP